MFINNETVAVVVVVGRVQEPEAKKEEARKRKTGAQPRRVRKRRENRRDLKKRRLECQGEPREEGISCRILKCKCVLVRELRSRRRVGANRARLASKLPCCFI